jgi:hypothetical protein
VIKGAGLCVDVEERSGPIACQGGVVWIGDERGCGVVDMDCEISARCMDGNPSPESLTRQVGSSGNAFWVTVA